MKASSGTDGDATRGGPARAPLTLIEGLRCDECGVFGAFDLGERRLCEDCYRQCGSCCLEFGADDLWSKDQ